MTTLVQLPQEILDQICDYVDRRELLHLSKCASIFTDVCRRHLFREIDVQNRSLVSVTELLYARPEIARSVMSLKIYEPDYPEEEFQNMGFDFHPGSLPGTAGSGQLYQQSVLLWAVHDLDAAEWLISLNDGVLDAHQAILLTLLPSLEHLEFTVAMKPMYPFVEEGPQDLDHDVHSRVCKIISHWGRREFCLKLKSLVVRGQLTERYLLMLPIYEALKLAVSFPNIKRLTLNQCRNWPLISRPWTMKPLSELTRLELIGCHFSYDFKDLDPLIRWTCNLKTFVLRLDNEDQMQDPRGWQDGSEVWGPLLISVLEPLKATLQNLHVGLLHFYFPDHYRTTTHPFQPFPEFEQLRRLVTYDRLLWGEGVEDETVIADTLMEVFPETVEEVKLACELEGIGRSLKMLQVFLPRCKRWYPDLRLIVLDALQFTLYQLSEDVLGDVERVKEIAGEEDIGILIIGHPEKSRYGWQPSWGPTLDCQDLCDTQVLFAASSEELEQSWRGLEIMDL